MDSNSIAELEKKIKITEERVKNKIQLYSGIPKIVLLGNTGSGKSSLTCALTNNVLKVAYGEGKSIVLDGEGIFAGSTSGTRDPNFYIDETNELIYCDCPGFDDTEGMEQEIINSFADDYILSYDETGNYIKILLVVSASEFESKRGSDVLVTIERMKKMFPNHEELKKAIGLVVTKGKPEISAFDYIERINERAPKELKNWCEFFKENQAQVFYFPIATLDNIGKDYTFNDYDRLLNFVNCNFIENPEHQITLSNEALLELKVMRAEHSERVKQIITELFLLINEQYRKADGSSKIETWLEVMHHLLDQKIKKTRDFGEVMKKYVPNCEQFMEYFIMLEDFEAFDLFIDRVFKVDDITSCLQETFRYLTHAAIQELEKNLFLSKESEIQDQMIKEKTELIKKYEENEEKNQQKIIELTNKLSRQHADNLQNQRANQRRIDSLTQELGNLRNSSEEAQRQSQTLINQLKTDLRNQEKYSEEQEKRIKELENRPKQPVRKPVRQPIRYPVRQSFGTSDIFSHKDKCLLI